VSRYAAIALPDRVLDGPELFVRKAQAMSDEYTAVIDEAAALCAAEWAAVRAAA